MNKGHAPPDEAAAALLTPCGRAPRWVARRQHPAPAALAENRCRPMPSKPTQLLPKSPARPISWGRTRRGFMARPESDTAVINLLRRVHTQGMPWANHHLSGCAVPLDRTCPSSISSMREWPSCSAWLTRRLQIKANKLATAIGSGACWRRCGRCGAVKSATMATLPRRRGTLEGCRRGRGLSPALPVRRLIG